MVGLGGKKISQHEYRAQDEYAEKKKIASC
jgi:hypothetical protein